LIRDLLLEVAANPDLDGHLEVTFTADGDHSLVEVTYHGQLLIEAGYLKGNRGMATVSRLTWDGHEFLDNIRDPRMWKNTKERLKGLPSVAIAVVAEIAKSEIKKHLGLP
jgi:hypothetical protein